MEADEMRNRRARRGDEHDHVLANLELRRADHDAAVAPERPTGDTKPQQVSEVALEILLGLERDDRLDRAPIVGPLSGDVDDSAAGDGASLARQFGEIDRNDDGRAKRYGERRHGREHRYEDTHGSPMAARMAAAARRLAPGAPRR